eukprot:138611-Rhodomonas_salina.3
MDADASSLSCAIGAGMESETLGSDEELNSDNNEFRTSPVHVISHETAIESLRDFIMHHLTSKRARAQGREASGILLRLLLPGARGSGASRSFSLISLDDLNPDVVLRHRHGQPELWERNAGPRSQACGPKSAGASRL